MRSGPRLGARLRALAALVPEHSGGVADVGAGHGGLASHLAATRAMRVVAIEVADGPFADLSRNLAAWNADRVVEARRGKGLGPLEPGEVDGAVVAGVSARTAISVCAEASAKRLRWMVVQCVQRPNQMERWLGEQGWAVLRRVDVEDRHRRYPTWLVEVPP